MIKIRGIEFNPAFVAAGCRGFYGEGNPFAKDSGDWRGASLTTKTCTYSPWAGHLDLDCFQAYPGHGMILNAVALTNSGVRAILAQGAWQKLALPFVISFATIGDTPEEREWECIRFRDAIYNCKNDFRSPFAIEYNVSCANLSTVKSGPTDFAKEVLKCVEHLHGSGAPVIVKVSVDIPLTVTLAIAQGKIDGVTISNSVKWKSPTIADGVWRSLSLIKDGKLISPLEEMGGGALSGATELRDAAVQYIVELRDDFGIEIPIIGGGGIKTPADVRMFMDAGASAINFWTISHFQPRMVKHLITEAHNYQKHIQKRRCKSAI